MQEEEEDCEGGQELCHYKLLSNSKSVFWFIVNIKASPSVAETETETTWNSKEVMEKEVMENEVTRLSATLNPDN